MQPIKWTDRKFSMGYDKGYVPFFIERLKGTAPRLEELLNSVDESHASLRLNNEWSIKEHAGHLSDIEKLNDGRIDDFKLGLPMLRAADMTNKETHEANYNEKPIGELISLFRNIRGKYIERLESLDEQLFERKSLHPRLQQKISLTDLLFFIAEHDNHHLTRIAGLSLKK